MLLLPAVGGGHQHLLLRGAASGRPGVQLAEELLGAGSRVQVADQPEHRVRVLASYTSRAGRPPAIYIVPGSKPFSIFKCKYSILYQKHTTFSDMVVGTVDSNQPIDQPVKLTEISLGWMAVSG